MKSILVVEDDEFFRKAICDLLRKKNFEVFEAPHGKGAVGLISLKDFDLVLSDIQMPGMNGIELLEWSIKNKPVPFIIMTGFSTILETHSAYELGAKGFITKPFKNNEIIDIVNKVLKINLTATENEKDIEYCQISIDEFVSGKQVEFDIYVKLSPTKHIKIAHKGEDLLKERILQYKEKGVKSLYITKDGFTKLVGFNLNIVELLEKNKEISHVKKVNFLKYTGEIILAKLFLSNVDEEAFKEAEKFVGLTVNIITDSKRCLDLLSMLNAHSDSVYTHSVGVAMYSVMIAQKMGFESNQAFFKLSMASMFHDVGKKEIDKKIIEKERFLLTAEEKKILDSHVIRGQEILLSLKGIPDDVTQLVFEHHEDTAGTGYPVGGEKKHQHPLSKIIQLANTFVSLAIKGTNHSPMSGHAAIKLIESTCLGRYDLKTMNGLKAIFNIKE